ncbi:Uncharacterised protein [Mycobacteroides abscessus subsp. abscessus]|nr:Uncharacterised protein [Mycobacteroides abscessus subsp. abscessus]
MYETCWLGSAPPVLPTWLSKVASDNDVCCEYG